jgi:cytoskeleton protein RodZ
MTSDRPSGDVGTRLREARGRRGLSLRQVAHATKISIVVLDALERNDTSKLPGGIFSRAFVRSYAIEVGLDPEDTIQTFTSQFPNDSAAAGRHRTAADEDGDKFNSTRRTARTFLTLIAFSVPAAIAVLYFGAGGRLLRMAPAAAETPAIQTRATARAFPAGQALPDGTPAAATAAPASAAAPPADAPASITATSPGAAPEFAGPLVVGLTATRTCWVSAMVDGQTAIERPLQAGERQVFDVRRDLVLTTPDASALKLTLNGTDARTLGRSGEAVTARLNLTNFKEYLVSR